MTLIFHPDLIYGTSLGQNINKYNFFSYGLNEALHISLKERQIVNELFSKIQYELSQSIDKHSKKLITAIGYFQPCIEPAFSLNVIGF